MQQGSWTIRPCPHRQASSLAKELGLSEILVTYPEDNIPSRRVIEANGGTLDRILDSEALYWLATSQQGV